VQCGSCYFFYPLDRSSQFLRNLIPISLITRDYILEYRRLKTIIGDITNIVPILLETFGSRTTLRRICLHFPSMYGHRSVIGHNQLGEALGCVHINRVESNPVQSSPTQTQTKTFLPELWSLGFRQFAFGSARSRLGRR
jgi:hypothetical protein